MAREASITQEQVNAIANAMQADGAKPTARGIRDHLGIGSMATVLKYLQVWQGEQRRPPDAPATLPSALQRSLMDFAAHEVATAKAELHAELVATQQANRDLIAESERQMAALEQHAVAIDIAQAEKSALAGRLSQIESDLVAARNDAMTERIAAEVARTELATARYRLEAVTQLKSDLDRLHSQFEQERQARVAAEQNAAVLAAKLEAEAVARGKVEIALVEAIRRGDLAAELRGQLEAMKVTSKD